MSQKKVAPPVAKKGPLTAAGARAAIASKKPSNTENAKTVARAPAAVEGFILGQLTLGEMEGIGKDIQYQIAERGYKVLSQGKLDAAKKIFLGLLALDPYDSYFHTAYASSLQREGDYDKAEHHYTLALKYNPFNSAALANRGELKFQSGRVLDAAADLQAAIKNDPKGADPATLRARVLSIAISEVIKENKAAIMAQLKKAGNKPGAKPGGKPGAGPAKPGATRPGVATKPAAPAARPSPAPQKPGATPPKPKG